MENEKKMSEETVATEQTELMTIDTPKGITMWNDAKTYNTAFKMAKILSTSSIIPQGYQQKPGDCLLAIDMANRMNISPITVMQSSQVVRGNFSWKGSACKSMIDGCGRYLSSEYVEVGERGTDSWGYYLQAVDRNGKIINGVTVTVAMAKKESWYERNPKWETMTELMLKYRCASFFAKTECPSVLMGFQTSEEYQDIGQTDDKTVVTISLDESGAKANATN